MCFLFFFFFVKTAARPETLGLNSQLNLFALFPFQAAELAGYTAKITELEEAKRVKEEEAETWHMKVSLLTGD